MIWFYNASLCEKQHPYVHAVTASDTQKYAFGYLEHGQFVEGGSGTHYILQVEKGDNAFIDTEFISEGSYVRLVSLERLIDQVLMIDIDNVEIGTKLAPDGNGHLVVTENPYQFYFEVTEVIAYGVLATAKQSSDTSASSAQVGVGRAGLMRIKE